MAACLRANCGNEILSVDNLMCDEVCGPWESDQRDPFCTNSVVVYDDHDNNASIVAP